MTTKTSKKKTKKKKYVWKNKKPYQATWIKNLRKKRREEWIKQNGPCKACGTWENLQIDHINPLEKKYNPGYLWNRNKEFREAELVKCQVLCRSCHLKKTVAEIKARKKTKLKKSTS